MKILMLSKACVVGAYQRKLEELAALSGMELLVVVPPYWQEETRRLTLERLYTRGYRLEVEQARFNGKFHLFYFPRLAAHLRSFRPDLVHVDEEPYNLASWHALRLARRFGARSLFFTWQNLCRRYPPPFRWMERYCFHAVDGAIAGNLEGAEVLRRKGFSKPVEVIPQFGVDPEMFRAVPPLPPAPRTGQRAGSRPTRGGGERAPLPAGEPLGPPLPMGEGRGEGGTQSFFRIGYVGRMVEQKGIMDLLDAVARLKGEWRLALVGAGPLRARIEARAEELGLTSRLEVVPGVPSREMPGIMNSLDALVLPSRTRPNWKEQFGRALVEAMACQVPVIGSDSGEIPNVIGDAGLVFPEGNVEALAGHLETLRSSLDVCCELGERGRARVLARFTQARIAEQTHQVYGRILGREA